MAKHKIILISFICFSMALSSQKSSHIPIKLPPRKPGMTSEEHKKAIEEWLAQRRRQERERDEEDFRLMVREAWKNELRVSEQQWRIIEPRHEREELISLTTEVHAFCGISNRKGFYWSKATEDRGEIFPLPKTPDELTEGERIVDELIDLLRKENTSDEELRRKIDLLQQVRENARKELPKAKQELSAVLTSPRQEAVYLIMGRID